MITTSDNSSAGDDLHQEPFERLEMARIRAGYRSARQAALQNEWPESTYRAHENGGRTIGTDDAERYANAFNVPYQWLLLGRDSGLTIEDAGPPKPRVAVLGDLRAANVPLPRRDEMRLDLPVMGTAAGSFSGSFVFAEGVVDYVRRPPALEKAKDAYALFVQGDSMFPMYEPGELIFVHPHKPPVMGKGVVVQVKNHAADEPAVYLGKFAGQSPKGLSIHKLNPESTMTFTPETVVLVHRVMTANELFGV